MPTACPSLTHPECTGAMRSVRDVLDLLGGKWRPPSILSLSAGPRRFGQLQREVAGITAKMLSKELKELEQNGLLGRHVRADAVLVAVTYTLTPYSKHLFPVIEALRTWGQLHRTHQMHPKAVGQTQVEKQVFASPDGILQETGILR